jgi:rhamnose utilization protein RhaD (predicted bifunctional aldolase and dehydrogenase)
MARFNDNNRCALCGKPKEEGRKIIVGLHGAVCSDCVALCSDILATGDQTAVRSDPLTEVFERLGLGQFVPVPPGIGALGHLIALARTIGEQALGQVILAEGNVSAKDGDTFWIKASGAKMSEAGFDSFVQVSTRKVLDILNGDKPSDEEVRAQLNDARTGPDAGAVPSTEAFMHAWLLSLPGVEFVAHTHPVTTLGVLCGPQAREFAENRYFPDQIVLCGPTSPFVPYCAPGFELARAIRDACGDARPKTILLQNHGLIALGRTANEALAACVMTEKAAQVFVAAQDPRPLSPEVVAHIHNWSDEHYRQSKLWDE